MGDLSPLRQWASSIPSLYCSELCAWTRAATPAPTPLCRRKQEASTQPRPAICLSVHRVQIFRGVRILCSGLNISAKGDIELRELTPDMRRVEIEFSAQGLTEKSEGFSPVSTSNPSFHYITSVLPLALPEGWETAGRLWLVLS